MGSLVDDMIKLGATKPTANCGTSVPTPNTDPPTVCSMVNGVNVCYCCSDETKRLLGTTECIDQVRSQPRFIFEVIRSDDREIRQNDNLVSRMIQLCGEDQVPTELGGTRAVTRRKRSVNATSRIIPINQAFQSSSGQIVNTDLTFGKKTSKINSKNIDEKNNFTVHTEEKIILMNGHSTCTDDK